MNNLKVCTGCSEVKPFFFFPDEWQLLMQCLNQGYTCQKSLTELSKHVNADLSLKCLWALQRKEVVLLLKSCKSILVFSECIHTEPQSTLHNRLYIHTFQLFWFNFPKFPRLGCLTFVHICVRCKFITGFTMYFDKPWREQGCFNKLFKITILKSGSKQETRPNQGTDTWFSYYILIRSSFILCHNCCN